jgi:hypothetical protein
VRSLHEPPFTFGPLLPHVRTTSYSKTDLRHLEVKQLFLFSYKINKRIMMNGNSWF